MIIKNFLNKISISKYTYLIIFLCLITGLIKELFIVSILVIFHEFGHYLLSVIFKWRVSKINIYPFGGLIVFDEQIDKPLYQEFLITIFGPIFQWIIFLLILCFKKYLSNYFIDSLYNYHLYMFIFNLLPIIPLDGSKILNILLNKLFSYKKSNLFLSITSILFLIGFIICFKNNYSYYFVISFLIYEIINFIKQRNFMFYRFVYEKYLYRNNYKKTILINNINKMKRNKKHLIKNKNKYITEKEYIKKRSITPNKVYNMVHNKDILDNNS